MQSRSLSILSSLAALALLSLACGALVIWGVWSGSEWLTNRLPPQWATRAGPLRILLIGILLQVILLTRSQGLLPERPPKPVLGTSPSPKQNPAG